MFNINHKLRQFFSFVISIENKVYIISRFISVAIKPLMLSFCIFYNFKEFGTIISMIFLVSSTNIIFFSIPFFRNFYLNLNNKSALRKEYFKNKYKYETIILFLLSLIFIIPLNKFFENSTEILICTLLVFSVDKIYDEIQRFLIIKKDFYKWAVITNYKNISLLIFFLNPLININIVFLSIIYFIINFSKQFSLINITSIVNFSKNFLANSKKRLNFFLSSLLKNKRIYLMYYFVVFYSIADKIVVGKVFNEVLTEYILLANILSIPQLFINFFYISKYKAEFAKGIFNINDIILSKKFSYLLIPVFFVAFTFITFFYVFDLFNFSIQALITLSLIYIINSYSLIVDECIYWKSFYRNLFLFESISFFILLLIITLTIYLNYFDINLELFLIMLLIFYFLKIFLKYLYAQKKYIFRK